MHRAGPAVSFLPVERGSVPARLSIRPTLSLTSAEACDAINTSDAAHVARAALLRRDHVARTLPAPVVEPVKQLPHAA